MCEIKLDHKQAGRLADAYALAGLLRDVLQDHVYPARDAEQRAHVERATALARTIEDNLKELLGDGI